MAFKRGWVITALAALVCALLLGHKYVPNTVGNLGSLLETFLPWVGVAIPVLIIAAAIRKAPVAAIAAGLVGVVWLVMFGHLLVPKGEGGKTLRVLTHNVGVSNPDPESTARKLLEANADLVALQELSADARARYAAVLGKTYQHSTTRGTVTLWSRLPLAPAASVDIGIGWTRALRTEVQAPGGNIAVYVVHLASVRVDSSGFGSEQRNTTIVDLAEHIRRDPRQRVLLLGDLNGTAYDRSLAPLMFQLTSVQAVAGQGFGFTWPAGFPLTRIDHILIRGLTATDAWVLPRTGSDHRPIAADLHL